MDIMEMSDEQLRDVGKRYQFEIPVKAKGKELRDLVQIEMHKYRMQLEEKAKAERKVEMAVKLGLDPQTKAKPARETVDILNSPKVYVIFRNLEEEGMDVPFNRGGTHEFHLWDGFIHVMPKSVIDDLKNPDTPSGMRPVYAQRPHATLPGMMIDQIVGHKRRFGFESIDKKPPANSQFGVVLDSKLYEEIGEPYPQPVAHSV